MNKINIQQKISLIEEFWTPKIVAEMNNQYAKIAKFKGEMIWHTHENEDEFFFVIKGVIKIRLRDRTVELKEGECFVVPMGVEHSPMSESEAHVLMFEPKGIKHTGDKKSDLTQTDIGWV